MPRAPLPESAIAEAARRLARGEGSRSGYPPHWRTRMGGKPWLEEELELIRRWPPDRGWFELLDRTLRPADELAEAFLHLRGRTLRRMPLTRYEEELACKLLREGKSPREVARALGRSVHTVRIYELLPCARSRSRRGRRWSGSGQ